jgi:hypothetical protein
MIKLISSAFVKSECEISKEVDNAELDNPIKQAQDRLKFLLGRQLYDELYSQGSTTPTTFSTDNEALFDPYVKQFLAHQAYELYLIKSVAMTQRTGLRVQKSETDDPASDSVVNLFISTARETTQFYKGQMINYITEQQDLNNKYPLYDQDCGNKKFGTGSGITGVGKLPTNYKEISDKITFNAD